jgi:hypothetical protein
MKTILMSIALITLTAGTSYANSESTECRLIGAHMTPTVMLTMTKDENSQESQFVEKALEGDTVLELKKGSSDIGYSKKGATSILFSKSSKNTYKIVSLEDTKDLGTWQSKPEDDHCSAYGDLNTSTVKVEVSMIRKGKVISKKTALMACEISGGYHGYFGQEGCEIDEN